MKGDKHMNTQTIYEDFASVRNFTKTCFLQGLIDQDEFDKKYKATLDKYARELADGGLFDYSQAVIKLMQYEFMDNGAMRENMYQGGDNL
jgi:hypothetical protein